MKNFSLKAKNILLLQSKDNELKNINTQELTNHIERISIKKLFGYYNYAFPQRSSPSLSELVILYADNGAGKSNLLRLIFLLLSTANNKGHKTAIAQTLFSEIELVLSSGYTLRAKRPAGLLSGPVIFEIIQKRQLLLSWNFDPDSDSHNYAVEVGVDGKELAKLPLSIRRKIESSTKKELYFAHLKAINISCSILTPDRILFGDDSDSIDRLVETNRSMSLSEMLSRSRSTSLENALTSASNLIRKKAYRDAYGSGDSANSIYSDIISNIANVKSIDSGIDSPQKLKEDIKRRLKNIQDKYSKFYDYGLISPISTDSLLSSIEKAKGEKLSLINSIAAPYINSLEARANAIDKIHEIVESFVTNVNSFLRDKRLTFKVSTGFSIESDFSPQPLEVSDLSSGEQQLLLMFCHVLAARDSSSIFIIDEPEISLNIKWQRKLVTSLLEIAKNSGLQMIFASHSFEILAKHRDKVIALEEHVIR